MTDTLRIKRRAVGGAAGPPATLASAEIAYNEVDDKLYYGKGNSAGMATSIVVIGGAAVSSGATVYVSDTPPVGVPDGSIWFESDSGMTFLRYNHGTSTQWVQI
jgi:hypothetical protein